jgi:hypothetical protein
MIRKVFIPVLACLLISACIFFFFRLRTIQEPRSDVLTAIPTDAAFILETRQIHGLFKRIDESNIMWEDLMESESFSLLRRNARFLDSLLSLKKDIADILNNTPLFISAHPTGSSTDFLFACSLPAKDLCSKLEQFIQNGFSVQHLRDDVTSISTSRKDVCFFTFSKGLALFSASESLLRRAKTQSLAATSLANDAGFKAVLATAKSSRFDLRIFINYASLNLFLKPYLSKVTSEFLSSQGTLAGWAEMDAEIRPKSILMNGFCTALPDSNYLSLFQGQEPQNPEALTVMPSNTASFLYFSFSDFRTFFQHYSKVRPEDLSHRLDSLNKRYDTDLAAEFCSWIEYEAVSVLTETGPETTDPEDCHFVVLRSNNITRAIKALDELAALSAKRDSVKNDSLREGTHLIRHISMRGFIPSLFGRQFNPGKGCYAVSGNYIIFGNSTSALLNYLRYIDNDHSLNKDSHYNEFASNLASRSNVYMYSNIARSRLFYGQLASSSLSASIAQKNDLLIRFEAFGLQFSSSDNLLFNTAYLEENPVYKKETASLWETKLDTTFSSKPQLLLNHNSGTRDVFVQDDANRIYLISNTGKILWSKPLAEKLISPITQVDAFKNRKLQMLFNTRSHLYLIDRNGKDVEGFPVSLPSPATNALNVADYQKNCDYRILLACADKSLRNYTIKGKPVEGWKAERTTDTVTASLQVCNTGGKDLIIAADIRGGIYILDRHGDKRFSLPGRLPSPLCIFWLDPGKDQAHLSLIASDTLGNITRMSLGGKTEHLSFKEFGPRPEFIYADLNNDQIPEYIFLDRQELNAFTSDKSLLFSYTFNDTLISKPLFFPGSDHHGSIGVVSEKNGDVFLLNESGVMPEGFPLRGTKAFSIGDVNGDGRMLLITGEGKNIYAYSIP